MQPNPQQQIERDRRRAEVSALSVGIKAAEIDLALVELILKYPDESRDKVKAKSREMGLGK